MSEYTVKNDAVSEFYEKRSRFIGHVFFVETEEEAEEKIRLIKARYPDATHNCFAYSLRKFSRRRFSDDGEPQGTAGLPILTAIDNNGLVDCCVVVTRYFGGTLLGAGGLVRAYTRSAVSAMEEAGKAEIVPVVTFSTEFPYERLGRIKTLLSKTDARNVVEEYGENVTLTTELTAKDFSAFTETVRGYFYDQDFTVVCEKNGRR